MAPRYEKIQVKFTAFDLEHSNSCVKDAIELEDAANKVPVRHDSANSSLILSSERTSSGTRRWLTVSTFIQCRQLIKLFNFLKVE